MITAHVVLWTFFIVMGLTSWLVVVYGRHGNNLHKVIYIGFILSIYGVGLSVLGGIFKLLATLAGF